MTTLSELTTVKGRDALLNEMIVALQGLGFPAASWHATSVPRRLLTSMASTLAVFVQLLVDVTNGGLLLSSTGSWLTLLAKSTYGLDRFQATFTRGTVTIADTASAGPYAISAGQLTFTTANGRRYSNVTDITLPLDGTINVDVQAESPGTEWNVEVDAITELATPLPGVGFAVNTPVTATGTLPPTISVGGASVLNYQFRIEITSAGGLGVGVFRWSFDNGLTWVTGVTIPATGTYALAGTGVSVTFGPGTYQTDNVYVWCSGCVSFNPGPGGDWITVAGIDTEADDELIERCQAQWATLGYGQIDEWYEYYSRNGHEFAASVTKTLVQTCAPHTAVSACGTSPPTIAIIGTPADSSLREFDVEITVGGVLGVAQFRWRQNGGAWSGNITTGVLVALGATGIIVVFGGGTYSTDNTYSWVSCYGGIVLTLGGPTGPVGETVRASTDVWLQPKVGNGITLLIRDSCAVSVDVTATCYVDADSADLYVSSATTQLELLIAETEVGGTLYLSALIKALMSPTGTSNVVVSAPAADVVLQSINSASLGTVALTVVPV